MPPPPHPSVWLPVAVLQAAALVLPLADAADQPARGLPNCATTCGDVPVPYPFGVGAGCYHSPGFSLTCDTSQAAPRQLLGAGAGTGAHAGAFQVLNMSLANATVRAARTGGVNISLSDVRGVWRGLGDPGPYGLKDDSNELVVVGGCDVLAQFTGASPGRSNITISGCASFCPGTSPDSATTLSVTDGRCTGVGC